MSYAQFGYAPFPPTTQLMVGPNVDTAVVSSSPCCGDSSRGSSSVPTEAQTAAAAVLPASYETRLLSTYPRLAPSGLYPGASPYADPQTYANFPGVESPAFYPSLSTPYGMKDASDPWRGITSSASYYYDPSFAAYGYGGLDFNGARRKNVTRDSTSTLKAWLNEHRKNPYPTKGEKIMLAIITKMTLTQVSTWFANARRRLKKENKMTWEPRNKMDADEMKEFDDDDDESLVKSDRNADREDGHGQRKVQDGESTRGCPASHHPTGVAEIRSRCDSEDSEDGGRPMTSGDESDGVVPYRTDEHFLHRSDYHLMRHHHSPISNGVPVRSSDPVIPPTDYTPGDSSSSSLNGPDIRTIMQSPGVKSEKSGPGMTSTTNPHLGDHLGGSNKPKIWSLADTATSKTPPVAGLTGGPHEGHVPEMIGQCGWFSVNPYQVNGTPTFAGHHHHHYHHPHAAAFVPPAANSGCGVFVSSGSGNASGVPHGFSPVPPQTDTPPQTPPNMKVSSSLPLGACSGYIGQGAAAHLYVGQSSTASLSTAVQAGKSCAGYPSSHRIPNSRTQLSEAQPDEFSTSEQYRPPAPPLQ